MHEQYNPIQLTTTKIALGCGGIGWRTVRAAIANAGGNVSD